MLTYEQALENLLAAAQPSLELEEIDTLNALGRVLASPVVAQINVPPTDNAAMDGYAVRCAELVDGAKLPISQRVPAGSTPGPLTPGSVARIFTGAPIPAGADAVVMQEHSVLEGDRVRFEQTPKPAGNIRRAGEDLRQGSEVLPVGTGLTPPQMGLLASVGIAKITVYRRLRVAMFFTGDELTMPGEALRPGAIYNSNRYVLHGLLAAVGCEIRDLGIVRDDLAATRAALREAARDCDLILTCGGVSVGEEDHVKAAVKAEGALDIWKVGIRPGKPFAFGCIGETPFIGLPGNPVSGFVTYQMLVQPYLRKRQGLGEAAYLAQRIPMRADFVWPRAASVREFLRARRNSSGGLDLFPKQGSGVLTSCAWADGLVDNPPDRTIETGDEVQYIPLVY